MTCRASNLCNAPWDLWSAWTSVLCVSVGLAFPAVAIFQIGTNMYRAFGGFAKFDRRYLPMTPRDSNNLKAKERN